MFSTILEFLFIQLCFSWHACMHAYSFLVGLATCVCVCVSGMRASVCSSRLVTYIHTLLLSSVFWVQFPVPSCRTYFLWQKRWCLYTQFYIQSDPPHSSGAAPALSRHSSARSPCGAATEDSVTNGNYICVFFMNPSNTGLLKMLPRYLSLSATSSWDQIGMLLRQSRTTHPLVSPVMCVTACVGEYHVLFNYKCTLSTVVDVLEIGPLQVQFEVCYVYACPSFPPKHGVRLCAFSYLRTPTQHRSRTAPQF